jgi:hypothetical protein
LGKWTISYVGNCAILTAAHEVDNLQFVSVVERDRLPLRAWDDLQIQLHRDTISLHSKMFNEGCNGQAARKVTLLAIDLQFHSSRMHISTWLNADG